MESVQTLKTKTFDVLKDKLDLKNVSQSPVLQKIVISVGTGRIDDRNKIALIQDRLAKITGQKPAPCKARKSIAAFKLRQGDVIGYKVTLRGDRMFHFFDKLVHLALPQTRDFRGLKTSTVDDMGNCTIGIREHTIFPETSDEELKDVFGLSVTIVTSANSKKEAELLLRYLGLPLQKDGR